MAVQELLTAYPQTTQVILSWHADCLGCSMQRFCTLAEVVENYELDMERLLADLRRAATSAAAGQAVNDDDEQAEAEEG
jgi:hybrid cluster-associated redox disulfide protein